MLYQSGGPFRPQIDPQMGSYPNTWSESPYGFAKQVI